MLLHLVASSLLVTTPLWAAALGPDETFWPHTLVTRAEDEHTNTHVSHAKRTTAPENVATFRSNLGTIVPREFVDIEHDERLLQAIKDTVGRKKGGIVFGPNGGATTIGLSARGLPTSTPFDAASLMSRIEQDTAINYGAAIHKKTSRTEGDDDVTVSSTSWRVNPTWLAPGVAMTYDFWTDVNDYNWPSAAVGTNLVYGSTTTSHLVRTTTLPSLETEFAQAQRAVTVHHGHVIIHEATTYKGLDKRDVASRNVHIGPTQLVNRAAETIEAVSSAVSVVTTASTPSLIARSLKEATVTSGDGQVVLLNHQTEGAGVLKGVEATVTCNVEDSYSTVADYGVGFSKAGWAEVWSCPNQPPVTTCTPDIACIRASEHGATVSAPFVDLRRSVSSSSSSTTLSTKTDELTSPRPNLFRPTAKDIIAGKTIYANGTPRTTWTETSSCSETTSPTIGTYGTHAVSGEAIVTLCENQEPVTSCNPAVLCGFKPVIQEPKEELNDHAKWEKLLEDESDLSTTTTDGIIVIYPVSVAPHPSELSTWQLGAYHTPRDPTGVAGIDGTEISWTLLTVPTRINAPIDLYDPIIIVQETMTITLEDIYKSSVGVLSAPLTVTETHISEATEIVTSVQRSPLVPASKQTAIQPASHVSILDTKLTATIASPPSQHSVVKRTKETSTTLNGDFTHVDTTLPAATESHSLGEEMLKLVDEVVSALAITENGTTTSFVLSSSAATEPGLGTSRMTELPAEVKEYFRTLANPHELRDISTLAKSLSALNRRDLLPFTNTATVEHSSTARTVNWAPGTIGVGIMTSTNLLEELEEGPITTTIVQDGTSHAATLTRGDFRVVSAQGTPGDVMVISGETATVKATLAPRYLTGLITSGTGTIAVVVATSTSSVTSEPSIGVFQGVQQSNAKDDHKHRKGLLGGFTPLAAGISGVAVGFLLSMLAAWLISLLLNRRKRIMEDPSRRGETRRRISRLFRQKAHRGDTLTQETVEVIQPGATEGGMVGFGGAPVEERVVTQAQPQTTTTVHAV